ncbi:MAG TPA: response regulator, partial [Chloroflexota bacterium]|nr:response regulator [Chloroflexota bacterium]
PEPTVQAHEPATVEPSLAGGEDVVPLLDELAETILTLQREAVAAPADLATYRNAFASWLSRFDAAAGVEHVEQPDFERTPSAQAEEQAVEEAPLAEAQTDTAQGGAAAIDGAAEEALRASLEAEIRQQLQQEVVAETRQQLRQEIEAEVYARMAVTVPAPDPRRMVHLTPRLMHTPPAAPPTRPATARDDVLDVGIDPEMLDVFRLEASEHLKRIDDDVALLDGNPGDTERLRSLRRSVHTLKGAAAMMGFDAVAALAHSLEDRLEMAVDGVALDASAFAHLLADLDRLEQLVRGNAPVETHAPDMMEAPGAAVETAPAEATPLAVSTRLVELDSLLAAAGETSVSIAAWQPLLQSAEGAMHDFRRSLDRVQSLLAAVRQAKDATPMATATNVSADAAGAVLGGEPFRVQRTQDGVQADFDPLELDRYTPIDHVAYELAEIAAEAHAAERELWSTLESAGQLATEQRRHMKHIQDRLLDIRLVPLDDLAGRLQRAAKGVAARRSKEVAFVFDGGEVAIDRAILDPVSDALIHLVRNAVDHGLEVPAVRRQRGKPASGTVTVVARQEQSDILIQIEDDGAGIDLDRVTQAARTAGVVPENGEGTLDLIFQPGLSTASQIDDVSGRGVGLDAVTAALSRVRGSIQLETTPGKGTRFLLRVPVTLAQAHVMMTEIAGNPIAIPAGDVKRVARAGDVRVERYGDLALAHLDDQAYPVSDLASLLRIKPNGHLPPADPPILFVESAGRRGAWLVDAVGQHNDVVVKPLGNHLAGASGLTGASLLQDGRVALILYPPDLLSLESSMSQTSGSSHRRAPHEGESFAGRGQNVVAGDTVKRSLRVLVVDDSPTIRKLLVRTLNDLGWQPAEAKDGAEALEAIRVQRPDAVLADIEMPRLDGYGLLAALRAQPETADLPVLMLTSRTADRHRQRATELGASGYLTKPYRPEEVVAELRRLGTIAHPVT